MELTTMMVPLTPVLRLPIRLPLVPMRPPLMPRTRPRTRWTTTELLRTEPDGITRLPPPPRTPLMPTRLPTEPELPMRRINSSEDKTRTETSISMRPIRPTCPQNQDRNKHLDETDK